MSGSGAVVVLRRQSNTISAETRTATSHLVPVEVYWVRKVTKREAYGNEWAEPKNEEAECISQI